MGGAASSKLPIVIEEEDEAGDGIAGGGRHNYTGLENFGTTCYVNSVLQSLYFCSPFRRKLFEYHTSVINAETKVGGEMPSGVKRGDALLVHLVGLFQAIARCKTSQGYVSPRKFTKKLRVQNAMFDNDDHHDAHEFLNYLLNDISECVQHDKAQARKRSKKADATGRGEVGGGSSINKTWIDEIFGGVVRSKMKCLTCECVTTNDQAVLDVSVETSEDSTLSECLLRSTDKEYMQGRDKAFCEHCNSLQEAERSMHLVEAPNVLAVHLKRFKFLEEMQRHTKLRHRVQFPDTMDLRCPDENERRRRGEDGTKVGEEEVGEIVTRYRLRSVIAHIGSGSMHGHYVAMVRKNNRWVLFDDEEVDPVGEDAVKLCYGSGEANSNGLDPATSKAKRKAASQVGYILFYEALEDAVV